MKFEPGDKIEFTDDFGYEKRDGVVIWVTQLQFVIGYRDHDDSPCMVTKSHEDETVKPAPPVGREARLIKAAKDYMEMFGESGTIQHDSLSMALGEYGEGE